MAALNVKKYFANSFQRKLRRYETIGDFQPSFDTSIDSHPLALVPYKSTNSDTSGHRDMVKSLSDFVSSFADEAFSTTLGPQFEHYVY